MRFGLVLFLTGDLMATGLTNEADIIAWSSEGNRSKRSYEEMRNTKGERRTGGQ